MAKPVPLLRVLEGFGTMAQWLDMPKTELNILKFMPNSNSTVYIILKP
jgi:hypothetical protein